MERILSITLGLHLFCVFRLHILTERLRCWHSLASIVKQFFFLCFSFTSSFLSKTELFLSLGLAKQLLYTNDKKNLKYPILSPKASHISFSLPTHLCSSPHEARRLAELDHALAVAPARRLHPRVAPWHPRVAPAAFALQVLYVALAASMSPGAASALEAKLLALSGRVAHALTAAHGPSGRAWLQLFDSCSRLLSSPVASRALAACAWS
jgi:hypothetical protein